MAKIIIRKPKVALIETTYTTVVNIDGEDFQFYSRHRRKIEPPKEGRISETSLRSGKMEKKLMKEVAELVEEKVREML